MREGAVGKQGMPVTRDPGRVLRPGDEGFPGDAPAAPQRKTRTCCQCFAVYTPTSNAQKRCPACQAKATPPKAAAAPHTSKPPAKGGATPKARPRAGRAAGKEAGRKQPVRRGRAAASPAVPPAAPTLSIETPFNTGLLIRLLRAAAACLEALDRG